MNGPDPPKTDNDFVTLALACRSGKDWGRPESEAANNGHAAVAKLLLAHGAEVNAEDNDGRTPSQWAALGGHKNVVELLRQHGDSEGEP